MEEYFTQHTESHAENSMAAEEVGEQPDTQQRDAVSGFPLSQWLMGDVAKYIKA